MFEVTHRAFTYLPVRSMHLFICVCLNREMTIENILSSLELYNASECKDEQVTIEHPFVASGDLNMKSRPSD